MVVRVQQVDVREKRARNSAWTSKGRENARRNVLRTTYPNLLYTHYKIRYDDKRMMPWVVVEKA